MRPEDSGKKSIYSGMFTWRYSGRCWRILAPKWASEPLSGAGAARLGGRWNPKGLPALYMSEEIETAFMEYQQDLLVRPGTFCAYQLDVESVADLCDPAIQAASGVTEATLLCPWKEILLVQQRRPPTWEVTDKLLQLGCAGVRVPSARRKGGINLVLWHWNDAPTNTVEVLDPRKDLPRNQSSWDG